MNWTCKAEGRKWGWMAVCLGTLVLAAAGCRNAHPPPRELLGLWNATGNATYEGSSFEITATSIIFRRGEGYVDRNTIVDVVVQPQADKTTYDILYRNFAGGEQTLSLHYIPGPNEKLIRFKYQPDVVWRGGHGRDSAP